MPWQLTGCRTAIEAVSTLINKNRLPHALLLSGPKGYGKFTLAQDVARALNCHTPESDGAPCGHCPPCLKIGKGVFPDLMAVEPTGRTNRIKIDDIRALMAEIAFKPYEGKAKVFIIKDADRLNQESGNALLKTLEEPPPASYLILTSTSEKELLPTIVSRCLRLKLPPLAEAEILDRLADERGLSGHDAALVAAVSGGSLGRALSLEAADVYEKWQRLVEIMGLKGPDRLRAALNWAKTQAEPEDQLPLVVDVLRLWWREILALSAGGRTRVPPQIISPAGLALAERLTGRTGLELMKAVERLDYGLARLVKPELVFENYWLEVFNLLEAHNAQGQRP